MPETSACLLQSDYNPVEEPSWNIAASFDAGAFQNGASWLSPLGAGAAAVSPPKASPQRELSEVRGTYTDGHDMLYTVSMRQVAHVGGADSLRASMRQLRLTLAMAEQLWCLRVACLCAESVSAISTH